MLFFMQGIKRPKGHAATGAMPTALHRKVRWITAKLFRFCGAYLLTYCFILIFATAVSFAASLINREMINELSKIAGIGRLSSAFVGLAVLYMSLYFLQRANGFIITFGSNFFTHRAEMIFHKIFMWKSYHTPQESFFDSSFMERYSFVGGNTGKLSSFFRDILTVIFVSFGSLVGSLTLFILYEPWLLLYVAVLAVSTVWINAYVTRKEYELDKKQVREQRFHDYYKDILTVKNFAKELRIYGIRETIYEKWLQAYDTLRLEKLELALKKAGLGNRADMFRFFCRVLAIILLLTGISRKRYDIGTFVLLFGLIENCAGQVNYLSATLAKGVFKDVKYLADYYDFVAPMSNEEMKKALSSGTDDGGLYFGDFRELSLEHVSFSYFDGSGCRLDESGYRGRKGDTGGAECTEENENAEEAGRVWAVKDVSLTIRKGEIVSILGYNGSGKTTLSKLLSGSFAPDRGKIKLNQIEVTDENRRKLFAYFGTMPQEYSRFSIPVREYVGLGRIEKMEDGEELGKAYSKAEIQAFLDKYAEGDRTILGKEYDDSGVDLSGGEWQRLAVASAYMGEPQILLMDEPTASIDPLKEAEFIDSLRNHLGGQTAILISHRIGMARLADRIIMMQDGAIREEGSHEELLKQGGYYAKLFTAQKELYEEDTQ